MFGWDCTKRKTFDQIDGWFENLFNWPEHERCGEYCETIEGTVGFWFNCHQSIAICYLSISGMMKRLYLVKN